MSIFYSLLIAKDQFTPASSQWSPPCICPSPFHQHEIWPCAPGSSCGPCQALAW